MLNIATAQNRCFNNNNNNSIAMLHLLMVLFFFYCILKIENVCTLLVHCSNH